MRRPSHTPTSLQTHACRLISLHTDPTTLRHNHTPTFWRTASFTRRPSYTRTLLHTNSNTHTHAHTHTHTHTRTHTHTHTHTRTHTQTLLHAVPETLRPFLHAVAHTNIFTRNLYTQRVFHVRTTYPYTHTHRHHPRSIFSPMTDDLYFFFFVFAKPNFRKKSCPFIAKPNFVQWIFCPMCMSNYCKKQYLTKIQSHLRISYQHKLFSSKYS